MTPLRQICVVSSIFYIRRNQYNIEIEIEIQANYYLTERKPINFCAHWIQYYASRHEGYSRHPFFSKDGESINIERITRFYGIRAAHYIFKHPFTFNDLTIYVKDFLYAGTGWKKCD